MKRRRATSVGDSICESCRMKHVIEGNIERWIEVTGRRARRRKQLPDDLKDREDTVKISLCGTLVSGNSLDLSFKKE
jgi:hypothetical protein